MTPNDWNQNGNIDFGDDFIEYSIFRESMGDSDSGKGTGSGDGSGCSFFLWMGIILFVVGIFLKC